MTSLPEPVVRHWDFPRGIASAALLVRFGAERGVPRAALLDGSGITEAQLADAEAEIDAGQELRVVHNLVTHLPDSGAEAGTRYHITTFGVLGFAFLSAATMQDAVNTALRFLDLSFAFTAPAAVIEDDRLVLTLHEEALPREVAAFLVERDLAAIHTVIGELVGGPVPVLSVQLARPAPTDTSAHERAFGVVPRYDAPGNRSTIDSSLLARALPLASPETTASCEHQCAALAARRRERLGVPAEVRRLLRTSPGLTASMPVVARSLGLSTRTLRRRLADCGTTYQLLLDEARAERAAELLRRGTESVERIATLLGFAESASFIQAFRRWYGTTPGRFGRARVSPVTGLRGAGTGKVGRDLEP